MKNKQKFEEKIIENMRVRIQGIQKKKQKQVEKNLKKHGPHKHSEKLEKANPGFRINEQGMHVFAKGNPFKFKPGHPGISPGRPPKSILDEALEYELSRVVRIKGKKGKRLRRQKARTIARAMLKQLLGGKRGMAQLVAERVGGKPMQPIEAKVEESFSDPEYRRQRLLELTRKAGMRD